MTISGVCFDFDPLFKVAKREGAIAPAWLIDEDGLVYVRCACGEILGSPLNHTIEADGMMSASVAHSQSVGASKTTCRFHVFGYLDGWVDGVQGPGSAKVATKKREQIK
jgi:hypothetical protein